ncbi:unnamed protein product [Rotaria socialis]|uniref:Uncharacterized protein n=1 Tax=Rotaria socialis TaxID=392032 RepID=A0A820XBD9_9BILA|nr:unnamed protein product [Rotaria socialis]
MRHSRSYGFLPKICNKILVQDNRIILYLNFQDLSTYLYPRSYLQDVSLDSNGSGLQLNDSNDKLANTTSEENFDAQSREVQFGNEFDLNRENLWHGYEICCSDIFYSISYYSPVKLFIYNPGHSSVLLRQDVFLNQLQLAKELYLLAMIISRNSFIETIDAVLEVLNFEYGTVELDMLNSKFSNIYFDCSPYHIINRELQQVIQQVDIKRIIPESSAPHLQIPERPNIWESHPIFVGRVYQLIAELFDIPLRRGGPLTLILY